MGPYWSRTHNSLSLPVIQRPDTNEYDAFYETYVRKVPEGNIVQVLENEIRKTAALFSGVSDRDALTRYAPGKWSVKETVGHMVDVERVMSYRALCVARGDETALPAFDENAYVSNANFDRRRISDLVGDLEAVRASTLRLFRTLDDVEYARWGTASGHPITARALAYIIAGHELHHRAILIERYGL